MKRVFAPFILFIGVLTTSNTDSHKVRLPLKIPPNFPAPVYDLEKNPITQGGFDLGKKLFYDGLLSRDGSVSCGSCHQQIAAFAHQDHPLSHGVDNKFGRRNALPVFNAIFKSTFFWDGGVHNLDLAPLNALENPLEMDEQTDHVLKKLNESAHYKEDFLRVFGVRTITSKEFLQALAQFMSPMISSNSRYDHYVRKEGVLLQEDEIEGMAMFRKKCSPCHATDLFTDGTYRNNGITDDFRFDKGREEITLKLEDKGKFQVPSLRNVEFTAPYMHDGSIYSLEEVMEHYDSGMKISATLDSLFITPDRPPGIELSESEKKKIILFLKTLSDTSFINDPRFSEY